LTAGVAAGLRSTDDGRMINAVFPQEGSPWAGAPASVFPSVRALWTVEWLEAFGPITRSRVDLDSDCAVCSGGVALRSLVGVCAVRIVGTIRSTAVWSIRSFIALNFVGQWFACRATACESSTFFARVDIRPPVFHKQRKDANFRKYLRFFAGL